MGPVTQELSRKTVKLVYDLLSIQQKGGEHMRMFLISLTMLIGFTISACSPEVGSEEWCADMKEKGKGDWTANEAADFAKHCIL